MREDDFPEIINNYTYLDNACVSLRPEKVINKVEEYYKEYPGCPGRSNHKIAEKVDSGIENARTNIAEFIEASSEDLVFTSGTTESINLVASGFDFNSVIISDREHNSNFLPWKKHELKIVETGDDFLDQLDSKVEPGDLVSLVHISNLDGFELPIREASKIAKENDAYILVDAAQSIPHRPFSVKEFKPDFVAFSGHKMLGPSGTGALYVSDRVKSDLKNVNLGGGSVNSSTYQGYESKKFPYRMESGLPNVAGILGFAEAVKYLDDLGMKKVQKHESKLSQELRNCLEPFEEIQMLNPSYDGVFSLKINGMDSHEVSLHLDKRDIAIRSGQHCVHPYFDKIGVDSTARISFYFYNNFEDVKKVSEALKEIVYLV